MLSSLLTNQVIAQVSVNNYNIQETSSKGQIYDPYILTAASSPQISTINGNSIYILAQKPSNKDESYAKVITHYGEEVTVYMMGYHDDGSFEKELQCKALANDNSFYYCNLSDKQFIDYFIRVKAETKLTNAQVYMTSSQPH